MKQISEERLLQRLFLLYQYQSDAGALHHAVVSTLALELRAGDGGDGGLVPINGA